MMGFFSKILKREKVEKVEAENLVQNIDQLLQNGEMESALAQLSKIIETSRDESFIVPLLLKFETFAIQRKEFKKPLAELTKKSLRKVYDQRQKAELYLMLGRISKEYSLEEAREMFEMSIRYLEDIKESTAIASYEIALIYIEQNLLQQAIKELERSLTLPITDQSQKFKIFKLLSEIYLKQGFVEKAIDSAYKSYEIAPDEDQKANSAAYLGELLFNHNEAEEASIYLRKAYESGKLEPARASQVRLLQARADIQAGRAEQVVDYLNNLIKANPEQNLLDEANLLLGFALENVGRFLDAVKHLNWLSRKSSNKDIADRALENLKRIRMELETGKIKGYISATDKQNILALLTDSLGKKDLLERLKIGLSKTHDAFVVKLENLISGKSAIDDQLLDEIEEVLILSDLGVETTLEIMKNIKTSISRKEISHPEEILEYIKNKIKAILSQNENRNIDIERSKPFLMMIVGVNGVGKTTTIAKLAYRYKEIGKKVLLVAADTFRAGAIEQLSIWAERVGVEIIKHQSGADPSAVVYDAINAAKNRNFDIIIVDTAGRLHTKVNLMEELKKIRRIANRELPGAPHETLLVLDATTGQNAVQQAKIFHRDLEISGIILTKLDGTAKGGIIVTIASELKLPIKLIGIGEKMSDLRDFDPALFTEALFAPKTEIPQD